MRALRSGPKFRLNVLNPAHVYDANRRTGGWRTLAHLLDRGGRKRASRILCQRGLLPCERNRWWRRRSARYDRTAERTGRRAWSAGCRASFRTEDAGLLWRNRRRRREMGRGNLRSRHRSRILGHLAAAGERVLWNRSHSVPNVLVHVLHIGDGVIGVPAVVVIVVDSCVIDRRVGIVHASEITLAAAITREVRIARSKGEPPYGCGIPGGEAHAEARPAADPSH
jgi:hypothetical protein